MMPSRRPSLEQPEAPSFQVELAATGRKIKWPPRLAAQLGRIPDHEVARRAGVSVDAVADERRRRGIAASRPVQWVEWTPEMLALLGTDSDRAVAEELGLPEPTVYSKRQRLGIPAHNRPRSTPTGFRWTRAALALLGTATDAEVARRLHIPKNRVTYQRQKRGIAAFRPRSPRVAWSEEMVRQLGTCSDPELARRFGIALRTVWQERWRRRIPPLGHTSGKVKRTAALTRLLRLPDREVMRRTGLSEPTVLKLRREYGIPRPPKPSRWTRAVVGRLGKERDAEIAADLGVHIDTVRQKRRSLGIPHPPSRRKWSERELALVDQLSLADFARLTGRSEAAVRQQRVLRRRRRADRR